MVFDGPLSENEFLGNLAITCSLREQLEDLDLPWTQFVLLWREWAVEIEIAVVAEGAGDTPVGEDAGFPRDLAFVERTVTIRCRFDQSRTEQITCVPR